MLLFPSHGDALMGRVLTCLVCVSLSVATPLSSPTKRASSNETCFDYIILGGGTTGLVLANRLSENASTTVAVIEAGYSVEHDYNITQIANWFINLGHTDVDWNYTSAPQVYTNNREIVYHSGKALGGTSTINGGTYMRAQKAQIDAWGQDLGNTGWDWDSLFPYYLKSEGFQPPTPQLVADGASYVAAVQGQDGPVAVGWSNYTMSGNAHILINETWQALGVPFNPDQSTGNVHGFSVFPSTANTTLEERADAGRNYLWPIASSRPNLVIFDGTLAEKILWDNCTTASGNGSVTASGVQIRPVVGGDSQILTTNNEVILSAGSLRSPVILEHSGVGNPAILKQYNIPVVVDLPQVGENLMDQANTPLIANASTNYTGYPPFAACPTVSDVWGSNASNVASTVMNALPAYASIIAAHQNNATTPAIVQKQLEVQADLIFNKSTPIGEILTVPLVGELYVAHWPLLPFSRGNVHLSSTNASDVPVINPNFFTDGIEWDAIAAAGLANFTRKFWHTPPYGNLVLNDLTPNDTMVPPDASVDQWMSYIKEAYGPNYHPVGTCAMMSKELGGVVDPNLLVYGTSNVRVIDGSVLPFQIDGHLTSTLYALAERASDIIKGTCP